LVDSSRWRIPHEEKEVLDLFITNPMFGLKKDPKADVFKRVLVQVVKAVEEGAIELKDKEKEKRLSALQEIINFDFFGKVFWKMNEIQRKQDTLNKALEGNKAKKNLIDEEKKLGEIEESANETKETISQIEEKISAQKREINNYLNEIKLFAQKCLKKTVLLEEEMY
ncbi:MAG: hypothetical protein NTY48_07275, partial [Candidatus Diapherotrites archaeon]|nr:hypothetical protein [Candidatus Diapherotrites archaeon]